MNVCRTSCKFLQEMRLNCIFAKAKLQNAHRNTKEKRGFFLRNALSFGIYTKFMQNYTLFPSFIQNLTNVFVKPNEQNRACSSYAMARKRRMKSNKKQDANKKMKDDRKFSSP